MYGSGRGDGEIVALIPARAGSRRVPGKNTRRLAGHPLLAYSIRAAFDAGIFSQVVVSTDDPETADVARAYGASVPFVRPAELASEIAPDIGWVLHALGELEKAGVVPAFFAILRPTSPFRTAATIRRAWTLFLADGTAHSLRAVELCHEHPAKMWTIDGPRMRPILENPDRTGTPWHSTPYQALPQIYIQNASLEIARIAATVAQGTIAGDEVMPFLTEGLEGFDINTEADWLLAEQYAAQHGALPSLGGER